MAVVDLKTRADHAVPLPGASARRNDLHSTDGIMSSNKSFQMLAVSLFLFFNMGIGSGLADPVIVSNFDYDLKPVEQVFNSVPRKVITTNGSSTELLLRLGLEDNIIGTTFLDNPVSPDLRAAYERLPVISPRYPTKEAVLSLEPDFIYGWNTAFAPQALGGVAYWNKLGIKTYIARNSLVNPKNIDNFYRDLRELGRIFEVEDRAEAIIERTKRDLGQIAEKTKSIPNRPRVMLGRPAQHGAFLAWGSDSLAGNMVELAGGEIIFPRNGHYSLEDILGANPEVIILVHMIQDAESLENQIRALTGHSVLSRVDAVKNERIHGLPFAEAYCSEVRIIDGVRRLAHYLHPEKFHAPD